MLFNAVLAESNAHQWERCMAGGQLAAIFTVLATESLRVSQMPSFGRLAAGPPAGRLVAYKHRVIGFQDTFDKDAEAFVSRLFSEGITGTCLTDEHKPGHSVLDQSIASLPVHHRVHVNCHASAANAV